MNIRPRDWQRIASTVRGHESRKYDSTAQIRARTNRQGRFDVLKVRNDTELTLLKGHVIGIGDALTVPIPYEWQDDGETEEENEQFAADTGSWLGEPIFKGEIYDESTHRGSFGILLEGGEAGDYIDVQVAGQVLAPVLAVGFLPGFVIENAVYAYPQTGEHRFLTTNMGWGDDDDDIEMSSHGGIIKWRGPDTDIDAGHDNYRWCVIDLGGDAGPFPVMIFNESDEEIPPYGCVRTTSGGFNVIPSYPVTVPDDFFGPWVFNGPHPIPVNRCGRGTFPPCMARYEEVSEEFAGGGQLLGPLEGKFTIGPSRFGIWSSQGSFIYDGDVPLVGITTVDARSCLEAASGMWTSGYIENAPVVFGYSSVEDVGLPTDGAMHWFNLGKLMSQIDPLDLQDFLDNLTSTQVYDLLNNLSASDLAELLQRLPGWSASGTRFLKSVSGSIQWAT